MRPTRVCSIQFYSVASSNKKSCCFNILQEKITYLNISVKFSVTIFISCIFFNGFVLFLIVVLTECPIWGSAF